MPKIKQAIFHGKQFAVGGLFAALALFGLGGVAMAQTPVLGDLPLGSPNAPVTVIEYASLTCPHCAHFNEVTLPKVKKELVDTGKVRLIFRDFPLDQWAVRAAMLARCGGAASYHSFIDVLFEQQMNWATAKDQMMALRQLGKLGGISDSTFDACMQNKDVEQAVLNSRLEAQQKYQIDSTPTFIINGEKHTGALSFEDFDKIVEPLVTKGKGADAAPVKPARTATTQTESAPAATTQTATGPAATGPAAATAATPAPASPPAATPPATPAAMEAKPDWLGKAGIAAAVVLLVGGGVWALRRKR